MRLAFRKFSGVRFGRLVPGGLLPGRLVRLPLTLALLDDLGKGGLALAAGQTGLGIFREGRDDRLDELGDEGPLPRLGLD